MIANKFKIGDKVRIRKDLKSNTRYGGVRFVSSMERYRERQMIICKITSQNWYELETGDCWIWTSEMFEVRKITDWKKEIGE